MIDQRPARVTELARRRGRTRRECQSNSSEWLVPGTPRRYKGPLVDGPVVDWTEGPVIEPGYLEAISRAHEDAGFDRVLIGYGAVAPEGWAVAATVLNSTKHLKVMVAHRPGFVQPVLLARMAATLDNSLVVDGSRIHFITGGDEADQRREGDFVPHDARYRRTGEDDVNCAPYLERGHPV